LVVLRNGEKVELNDFAMPKQEFPNDDGTTSLRYGFSFSVVEPTFWDKVGCAWNETLDSVRNVRLSLQMLLSGKASFKDVTGPVGIVDQMSTMADASETKTDALLNMLWFGGFIAVNLAVMNLLPIPALDGGRVVALLLTTAIEKITKKKVNPKYEGYINGIGMLLLLGLMAIIMFKDIIFIFKR
jgi:regulator of sigma E protease